MLDMLSTRESCQSEGVLSSVRKVIIDAEILQQVYCLGAISELDNIAQSSRQVLSRLFTLREAILVRSTATFPPVDGLH